MKTSNLLIILVAIFIAGIGILCIYSSAYQREGELWQVIYKRQILWLILGLALFLIASNFNYRHFWDWTYILYAAALLILFLVFVLGSVRSGAQRWIKIAWFNFQPSEIVKPIMVIFLARYFSKKSAHDVYLNPAKFGVSRALILPFIFIAIPMALIIEQPDLGSALTLLFIFMAMLFISQVRVKYIFLLLLVIVLSLPILWFLLLDYQKERLLVFLNPNMDPLGAGYTVIQSKIAIGSGGFFGKGWLGGTQSQLHFLPESHTDFIFATFAEEWGFIGCGTLLFLYYLLIRKGLAIAKRTSEHFGKLLAFGISLMLTIQVFVNIAMTLGFAPVVGLPLPLMSYGGSSMLVTWISLGILVNIDKTRGIF
jgi:rod shape determining protein RodA